MGQEMDALQTEVGVVTLEYRRGFVTAMAECWKGVAPIRCLPRLNRQPYEVSVEASRAWW